jgi:lipopolysaccharide heptosyltransferase II
MLILTETQRIKIAKWIDEYVGRWLIMLLARLQPVLWRQRVPAECKRILFVKFWGIGSIILTEPALRYLRQKFPAAQLDFLTLAQNRELFALIPHVDRVYALDFRHIGNFLLSAIRLVAQLRRQKYELIFDAEFFANFSALFSRLLKPRRLIGFSRPHSIKNRLLDVAAPFDDGQHAATNFFRLVKIGAGDESPERETSIVPRLALPFSLSKKLRFPRRPAVIMNINASALALERRWPPQRFAHLARWLLRRYEIDLILIGACVERKYTQAVAQTIDSPGRVHDLAGTLNLIELAQLISAAALFISNDSGPLHLAAALQKPVVGFYGPETPKRFGPLCDTRLIFYLGLPCSPCMSVDNAKTVNCTNNRRCMLDLKTALVIPRLQHFIDENELLPRRISKNEITTKEVIPSHKMSF